MADQMKLPFGVTQETAQDILKRLEKMRKASPPPPVKGAVEGVKPIAKTGAKTAAKGAAKGAARQFGRRFPLLGDLLFPASTVGEAEEMQMLNAAMGRNAPLEMRPSHGPGNFQAPPSNAPQAPPQRGINPLDLMGAPSQVRGPNTPGMPALPGFEAPGDLNEPTPQNLQDVLAGETLAQALKGPEAMQYLIPYLGGAQVFGLTPELVAGGLNQVLQHKQAQQSANQQQFENRYKGVDFAQRMDTQELQDWRGKLSAQNALENTALDRYRLETSDIRDQRSQERQMQYGMELAQYKHNLALELQQREQYVDQLLGEDPRGKEQKDMAKWIIQKYLGSIPPDMQVGVLDGSVDVGSLGAILGGPGGSNVETQKIIKALKWATDIYQQYGIIPSREEFLGEAEDGGGEEGDVIEWNDYIGQ